MPYTPVQIANAFIQTGELADALDTLTQHLDAQPMDDAARRLRMGVLLRLRDEIHLRTALADFDLLSEVTADDQVQRSVILERLGDLDGAALAMEQARALKSTDDRLTERLLHLLAAQGKIVEALDQVRGQERTWRWLQWEGDLLVLVGDDQTATARYGLALAQLDARFDVEAEPYLAPIKARILLARGHAYRRLEQIEQAEAHYLEAARLIPSDPTIPFYRGLLAAQRGDLEMAISLCRAGLASASASLQENMLTMLRDYPPELERKIKG